MNNTITTTNAFFRVSNKTITERPALIAVPATMVPLAAEIRSTNGVAREIGQQKWADLKAHLIGEYNAVTGRDNNPALVVIDRVNITTPDTAKWVKPPSAKRRIRNEEARVVQESSLGMWEPQGSWVFDEEAGRKVFVSPTGQLLSKVGS